MHYKFLLASGLWFISVLVGLPGKAQTTTADSARIVAIKDDSTRIRQLAKLGVDIMYEGTGRYEQALPYLQLADEQAKETGSTLLQAHVLSMRAELERSIAHWAEALRCLGQAEQGFAQLAMGKSPAAARSRYFVLLVKLKIAQIQLDNNDLVKARRSLEAARQYQQQHKMTDRDSERLVSDIYNSYSILEGKLKNRPKSLAYADTSAMRSLAVGDTSDYYVTLLNTAITRKNLGHFAIAVSQYEACAAYFARQKNLFALTMVYANMPRALYGLKRYDEGIRIANKAIAMANNTADRLAIQSDVNEALSQLYEAKGDHRQALRAFRQSKAQQDSLFNQEKERQIQELESKYEAEKRNAEIKQLNEERSQRHWQLAGLGGGALLLALLLGLSVSQSRRLRQGSQRMSKQADQLQLLMRELHHRAKNNLAIVSGLLELQANRTDDGRTKQAFQEGQQRIHAMSLIHQRLYQTDALTTIDLRDYISNLVQSMMNTYGFTPATLDLHMSLVADAVDADMAIPMGLIINEVLTNAFKYAFGGVEHPRLSVILHTNHDVILLEIADNGPGVDLTAWQQATGSFGKQLIRNLSDQLDAELTVENRQGTYVRLQVPVGVHATARVAAV
ncbi:sensor histidine kinase [Fibrella sp. HMF5335]|uniref:histidine kinase n=1 Tax=Fibrella rubiginis TaxID=2817060 RepID=A0A939K798_9BACT|nr:histidine kinase dimerization/phosphoacceptor domain -containing protein [Fibrella rubiginis]MBO0938395.1 sensor histidine kinase [Fibrella rubiginis]